MWGGGTTETLIADSGALCQSESVGHGATDENAVRLFQKGVDNRYLVADLGTPKNNHERTLGIAGLVTKKL